MVPRDNPGNRSISLAKGCVVPDARHEVGASRPVLGLWLRFAREQGSMPGMRAARILGGESRAEHMDARAPTVGIRDRAAMGRRRGGLFQRPRIPAKSLRP